VLGQVAADFYRKVIATSCRGCHVNMAEGFNWDHFENIDLTGYRSTNLSDIAATMECGDPANPHYRRSSMPNSAVTFDRFWKTVGTASDLPKLFDQFYAAVTTDTTAPPITVTCIPVNRP
jgi:hypothetical protein